MYLYIFVSALYRLSCGALILAVNWLMASNSNSFGWLAVTIALTFMPAMLVPLMWRSKSQSSSGKRLTQFSLLAVTAIAFAMAMIGNPYILLTMNTLIWFFFFVMESSWESWFASECQGLSNRQIEKFSSISMSTNQAALMLGPLAAAYIFSDQPKKIIFLCMIIYLICFAVSWFSAVTQTVASSNANLAEENKAIQTVKISGTEMALLLIWPTLAMFNFMLPAQIVSVGGSMTEVGLLDALMGLGMIVSGILVANSKLQRLILEYKLTLLFLIAAMLLWVIGNGLLAWLISVFLLGLSFNIQRIVIRGRLAKQYAPAQVGQLISRANSFSFIIIAFSLCFFRDYLELNWAIPFVFSLIIGVLLPLKDRLSKA